MNLLRGSWNVNDDEAPMHSPVRLLQKLSAYRASTASNSVASTPSPSPNTERKSTILSESTNFFARLWRPQSNSSPPLALVAASNEKILSSFDNIPEPNQMANDSSTNFSSTPRLTRRMSIIREVTSKTVSISPPAFASPIILPPLKAQATNSSTVTDPSFEDTTSDHPGDTTSEFNSQSFETNVDSLHMDKMDEQDERFTDLTYDERQRRLSQSDKSVIAPLSSVLPASRRISGQYHSDSLASPEANIDVSMVSAAKHVFLSLFANRLNRTRRKFVGNIIFFEDER